MTARESFDAATSALLVEAHDIGVAEQAARDQPVIAGLQSQVTAQATEINRLVALLPPPPPAFPPVSGALFYGASEDGDVVLEAQTGRPLGIDREYFQASQVPAMVDYAKGAAAKGSVPLASIKPQGTWADIAAGRSDAWVKSIIDGLAGIGAPVLWTIHHEPENDVNGTTLTAATFKAMCERVTGMHPAGRVFFGPVLMSGKYNPIPTPNDALRLKVEDWTSPKSGHYFGFDAYNHFDPTSGKPWRSVKDTFDWMVNGGTTSRGVVVKGLRAIDAGKPIVVAEYGVRDDPADPNRAPQWLRDTYQYALDQHLAGLSYFSSANNVNDGGSSWKLTGPRLAAFTDLIKAPTSVLTK